MDLSGVIFVVLALAWAVYLIPKTLKQHDEVARTRSLDRFSGSERVLAEREPVNGRDSRLVVHPSVPATRSVTTVAATGPARVTTEQGTSPATSPVTSPGDATGPSGRSASPVPVRRGEARRAAARVAARRRRRVLLLLLTCTALAAAASYRLLLPLWAPAIPGALVVAHVVLCRVVVRRETSRARGHRSVDSRTGRVATSSAVAPADETVPVPVVAEVSAEPATQEVAAQRDGDRRTDQEDTVGIPVAEMHARLHAGPDADGGALWDPLPVTLPTYVTKPKARRTVRTIDLGEPGTWTSGRTAEDAEIAARATSEAKDAEAQDGVGGSGRRAVGG